MQAIRPVGVPLPTPSIVRAARAAALPSRGPSFDEALRAAVAERGAARAPSVEVSDAAGPPASGPRTSGA